SDGEERAVPAGPPGLLDHSLVEVRTVDELLCRHAVVREQGESDARRQRPAGARQRGEGELDALREPLRVGAAGLRSDDAELVAAGTGDGVAAADRRGEDGCDVAQQAVAGGVALRVVDLLETIEVEDEHGELAPDATVAGDLVLEPLVTHPQVRDAGERVGAR